MHTAECGKFSRNSSPNLSVLRLSHSSCTPNPQGLIATKASVELNQSAFLLMTSCLQLDCLLERERHLGPGLEGCPLCCCHFTSHGGIQGPRVPSATISDDTRTNPQILDQKLFSAYTKCIQSMSLLFTHFSLV